MNFLIFSGPPNSGKSTSIRDFTVFLQTPGRPGYTIADPLGYVMTPNTDVKCVLKNGQKRILIWSETDQIFSINELSDYINQNQNIDTAIITMRAEGDPMKAYLIDKLKIYSKNNYTFEIPLGRMVRGNKRGKAVLHYLNQVQSVAEKIGEMSPFQF